MSDTHAILHVVFWTSVVIFVSALADNSGGYGLSGLSAKILRP